MSKRPKKNVPVDRLTIARPVTRSMNLENGSENSLPIPIDLILMIFSKLDVKSVAICRCVSKLWASILRHSDFTELFLSMSCSRSPKLLFVFPSRNEFFIFSSPQPQIPDENSSHVAPNYQMKFSYDGYLDESEHVYGLICFKGLHLVKGKRVLVLTICNPSTRQMFPLPKVKTRRCNLWNVFGYDPIGKQYKVLAMTKGVRHGGMCDEFQVLTLGSGKISWKMIDCIPHNPPEHKICINGFIFYRSLNWLIEGSPIICFDVRLEKFSFIKPTGMINFLKTAGIMIRIIEYVIRLINYNGKLGLLLFQDGARYFGFDGRSIRLKLWILEDLEKQEWSEHTFLFPTVPENIIQEVTFSFVGMTQTNEIVLSSSFEQNPFYLIYLNLEKKTIVRVVFQGMETTEKGKYYTFLHHVEDVKLYGSV